MTCCMSEVDEENADGLASQEEQHAPDESQDVSSDNLPEPHDGVDTDVLVPELADALCAVADDHKSRLTRAKERMRLGPVAVPLGIFTWSASLLLHGGIVA